MPRLAAALSGLLNTRETFHTTKHAANTSAATITFMIAKADPVAHDEHPPTILESALRYDRIPAVVLLVLVPLISWIWIVVMARDMYGPMTGASAWMMTAVWDVSHLLLLWAMWAVMMTGMMLPSASPMLLLYGVIARRSAQGTGARQLYALAAGYLMVWLVFSLGATAINRA
jgi:predicted metal-binding membrane protein